MSMIMWMAFVVFVLVVITLWVKMCDALDARRYREMRQRKIELETRFKTSPPDTDTHRFRPGIGWVPHDKALELNTTAFGASVRAGALASVAWRIIEPNGEAEFITTDVGIAIDSVEWGSTVERIENHSTHIGGR